MTKQKTQPHGFPLVKAFLTCMTVSALLLVFLVAGVLVYLSDILQREADLADYVTPNLELAHQFTAATAGLKSQGQLLRNARTIDELIARNQLLEDSIQKTRGLLAAGTGQQGIDTSSLANTIDQIHVVVIALFDVRERQLHDADNLQQESAVSIKQLEELQASVRSRVVLLTGRLLETGEVLSAIYDRQSGFSDQQFDHVVELDAFEKNSLTIQHYLHFNQSLEQLKIQVQELLLADTDQAVSLAMQQRDTLLQAMSNRAGHISDSEFLDDLQSSLSRIESQLNKRNNTFSTARSIIEMSHLQQRLSTALTGLTNAVPALADNIRSQSGAILADVFEENQAGLKRYRRILISGLGISLIMLGTVTYWLVYRQTVLPMSEISRQLDNVGTDAFRPGKSRYLIKELADLSMAVVELDQAQKEMQQKDALLNATNDELRRANMDLEQFAHVASHDLQEPLRMMQQFSEMLDEDYRNELDDDGKFCIDAITRSASRMQAMIRDTLEYASSSRTSQSTTSVDLEQILATVLKDKEIVIRESGAVVTVGNLPCVMANSTGMMQLFGNLLVNAIKYRREGVASRISVNAHYPSDTQAVDIVIKDNGVGIDSKYLERVFSPFERLNHGSVAGTGLGLAICSRVCEAHDWQIDVTSEVGAGSSFRIRIPLSDLIRQAA